MSHWTEETSNLQHFYTVEFSLYTFMLFSGWSGDGIVGYAFQHGGLLDTAQVPVLAYHSGILGGNCNTDHDPQSQANDYVSDLSALAQDLEVAWNEGYRIVPIKMILEWASGERSGATLPQKAIGITFDDGYYNDWFPYTTGQPACATVTTVPSAYQIVEAFLNRHPTHPRYHDLGYYLTTSFVIASRRVRQTNLSHLASDGWYHVAITDPAKLMDIQNHSADHDAGGFSQTTPDFDSHMNVNLGVGGYVDGDWRGHGTFCRIGEDQNDPLEPWESAKVSVKKAAEEIFWLGGSVPGSMPYIFATPGSNMSNGLRAYLEQTSVNEHHTRWAFSHGGDYVRLDDPEYNLKRFSKGAGCNWSTPGEFLDILRGVRTEKNMRPCHIQTCPDPNPWP